MLKWKDPNIIIGNIAQGNNYYQRKNIENEIIAELDKGNHILLSAPRRVGKTSIVKYLEQVKLNDRNCIFKNIQDIKSEKEFYETIYELILKSLKRNDQIKQSLKKFFSGRGIESISWDSGIKFKDKKDFNYKEEIRILIQKLENQKIKVILFIDELPDVLHYLYENNKVQEALGILKNIRSWRQDFNRNALLFVWTGSIGMRHIVRNISKSTNDINDLKEIKFKPFDTVEAIEYIQLATQNASVTYSDETAQYLIDKIKYPIPYFINLMLDEINKIAKADHNKNISTKVIDEAFNNQVEENEYFDDWFSRLYKYFEKQDADFMNELLVFIAHKGKINPRQIYDLSVKHGKTTTYMQLVKILLNDGYIVKNDDKYYFISPFLRGFWLKNNPYYEN